MPFNMGHVAQLIVQHNVEFVTSIFQVDAHIPVGVCRGVAQGYIASYLDSIQSGDACFLKSYRKKLETLRQNPSQFEALQGDLTFHSGGDDLSRWTERLIPDAPATRNLVTEPGWLM